jgi:MFS family permease
MAPAARSINPFRILVAHRNFRIFWIGQTASLIGTWMQTMALGWLALELSDSAFLVGVVSSIGSLPVLLLSLPAGVVADRVDRLRLVRAMQALMLCAATALWALTVTGHARIEWLVALAFANGLFSAFEIPARQALVVDLVGREDLHEAIALNSSGFNLARIVGPAVGAVVISTFGLAWCFALNALSYLAVLSGLFLVRLDRRPPAASAASPLEGIRQGVRYMTTTPTVRTLMGVVLVFSVFGSPYLTLMPVVARDLLGLGAGGYGALLAAVGVGGLSGALFLASVGARYSRPRLLVVSSFCFATLLVLFAFVRSAAIAWPVLLLTGFMMILNSALANGLLQSIVPDELRGRLMAAYSFIVVGMSQVVGSFLGGLVARAAGVDWAIGGGGAVMLAYSAWVFWRHPAPWRHPVAADA